MTLSFATIHAGIAEIADGFAHERSTRQLRRELDPADFERLRRAGFLVTVVPPEHGGVWQGVAASTRPLCEILRTLARADASVGLVAAMHPGVLHTVGWSDFAESSDSGHPVEALQAQRRWAFATARDGAWWGTISSEPGSAGDLRRTRAVACPDPSGTPGRYLLTGEKHFGSGAGVASFMITTAVPTDESEPDFFIVDMRAASWDGSTGLKLKATWDAHGMTASQSHAFAFENYPVARLAAPDGIRSMALPALGFLECCYAAVIVGIVDVALETARQELAGRAVGLRAYERVEWAHAEIEGWLVDQAFEGMLRAVENETEGDQLRQVLMGKTAIAELAESALGRICRAIGGGTYARRSPFGHWFEDVRALGFLRPPWGLAYESILEFGLY